jgi:hypothetical protein
MIPKRKKEKRIPKRKRRRKEGNKMIKLGKLILPTVISVNDIEDKISLRIPYLITDEFANCVEFDLHLTFIGNCVEIDYYSEEDKWLWLVLDLEDPQIAVGDLSYETFEAIQERALKKLCEYIDDDQREMLEHFDAL